MRIPEAPGSDHTLGEDDTVIHGAEDEPVRHMLALRPEYQPGYGGLGLTHS